MELLKIIHYQFVLIETLWNVKLYHSSLFTCFTSINRNIMECKEAQAYDMSTALTVLIETLWNVKLHTWT